MRVYCKKHGKRIPFGKYRDYCLTVSCPNWTLFKIKRGEVKYKANLRGLPTNCETVTTVVYNERG